MKTIEEVIIVRKTDEMKLSANISHMSKWSKSRSDQSCIKKFSRPALVGSSTLEKVNWDVERIL